MENQQPTKTDEFSLVRAGFEECYQEFAASGFDTLLIPMFLQRVADEEAFDVLGGDVYYRWRSLFEYFLRQLPENRPIERELLSLRVQDLWIKQREFNARETGYKNQQRITNHAVNEVFNKLKWYGIVSKEKESRTENAQDDDSESNDNPSPERNTEAQNQYTSEREEESVILENNQSLISVSQLSRLLRAVKNAGISVNEEDFAKAFGRSFTESIRTIGLRDAGERAKNDDLKRLARELFEILGETHSTTQLADKEPQRRLK